MAMVRGKDVMASVMNIRMMMMTVMAMIMKKIARMIMLRLSNR